MCGRFQLSVKGKEISERFNTEVFDEIHKPSYNCAPTQVLSVITDAMPHKISLLQWGLVPSWAKDLRAGNKNFNCRAETIIEKPTYRLPFKRQRCLVPANGFYEWKPGTVKQAYRFHLKNEALFAMAGIWDTWQRPDGSWLQSFSIITTEANEVMAPIHNRMPVILPKESETRWIYTTDYRQLLNLLKPYPADEMVCYPVSSRLNSVMNDDESLTKQIEKQVGLF
ncbi:MAG: SOS response-associated peptidase [Bacteroidales bacterium]|nr:SOS response-associated peptidase [Bacteroidales bacterium]